MHLKMHLRTFNINYELTNKDNILNNCKLWLFSPSFIGFTTKWCELECAAFILLLCIIIIIIIIIIMIIINIIIIISN